MSSQDADRKDSHSISGPRSEMSPYLASNSQVPPVNKSRVFYPDASESRRLKELIIYVSLKIHDWSSHIRKGPSVSGQTPPDQDDSI